MKRLVAMVVFCAAGTCWAFSIGSTRDEVIAELGQPTAEMKRGEKHFMYYGGGEVELVGGKVYRADGQIAQYLTRKQQGMVYEGGEWITRDQKKQQDAARVEQGKLGPKVKVIADGGKEVELSTLLVPGKITIVDFYADWCGPCRVMAPRLEKMAKDPDVYLRKVDIVDGDSDVSRQYDVHIIPNVRVYDAKGKMVGEPSQDPGQVRSYIEKARP
ncbi:MAG TPA: thioredoxin family protein [Kiritimatiellia bacterium]|jgi:thioredoxin 1